MKTNIKRYALYIFIVEGFGGAERRLIRIYNQIAKEKEIDLIIRGATDKQFLRYCESGNVTINNFKKILCYKRNKISDFQCMIYLLVSGYSVIHFFDYSHVYYVLTKFTKYFHIKTLCTIADFYYTNSSDTKLNDRIKSLLCQVDQIDLLYESGYHRIKELAGNVKISITPGTFTDLEIFMPQEKENLILFAAARLTKEKNPEMLVDAAILCQEELRTYNYRIIIIGKDYEEKSLREKIIEHNLSDIVIMKGYCKSSNYFPIAKVFTSLQRDENYPSQSIAEAYASGCYVIATNVGETRRIINKQSSSLIACEAYELSKVLIDYVKLPDKEQKKISKASREYAMKEFNIEKSVIYFRELLEDLS